MNQKPAATDLQDSSLDLATDQTDDGESPNKNLPVVVKNTKPPVGFWHRLKRLLFGRQDGIVLREDFSEALKNGKQLDDAFSADERAMLDNILLMREVRVENVMVPRTDIEAVDSSITLGELLTVFERSGHSRMPVFSDNLDDPKGMVHIRDLLAYLTRQARNGRRTSSKPNGNRPTKPLDLTRIKLEKTLHEIGIIRSVLFVPESMLAADLLKRMQATRTQMALVIDEYGGTDGLVSLEDVVEIVVGDIEDEHDDDDGPHVAEVSEGIWQAEAKASLEDLTGALQIDLNTNEHAEDVDTVGGLIFAELGRVPVRGEVIRMMPGYEFHITDADARRIKRVRIVKLKSPARRRNSKTDTDTATSLSESDDATVKPAHQN